MLIVIKQWESKYLRDFSIVKSGEITLEKLYTKIISMYYNFVSTNGIEPFTITYARGNGFCVNANSHVGAIVYEDILLYITSMVPDLTLGKILYLQSQTEDTGNDSITKQVITKELNNTENISAVDYFVVSLLNAVEDIKKNGLLLELTAKKETSSKIIGRLDLSRQVSKHSTYDKFCVERTVSSRDIVINRVIKTAISKAKEFTTLSWIVPMLSDAEQFFFDISTLCNVEADDFPKVSEITAIKRDDYERCLQFSKYILLGYDPFTGVNASFFPEFILDMNQVFELYVTFNLKKIFKTGFYCKKRFTLGFSPDDISIDRKNIELDGLYESNDKRVIIDTKNKYKSVLERDIPDFIAANPDIYQQYYYASRINAKNIILVYPSSRKRKEPIGQYYLDFVGHQKIKIIFWALYITGTPRENKKALINLAKFIDGISDSN